MARNYGISFCRKGIAVLESAEEELFKTVGHGYDKFSQANMQLMKYRRMLSQFTKEREAGLAPSYNPEIHGSFEGKLKLAFDYELPAATVRQLMRKHGLTIRGLAQKFDLTLKRVREVRANGVSGFAAIEWTFLISGVWPDVAEPLKAIGPIDLTKSV